MQHLKSDAGSFFFRRLYDLLWFSIDFTGEKERLQDLVRFYGDQFLCSNVENICSSLSRVMVVLDKSCHLCHIVKLPVWSCAGYGRDQRWLVIIYFGALSLHK